ncbi:LacI family transcriptional regulator, partial [Lawsonibacter sp. NSJ-52]|nr:LacI family transcriptional regulator [Lawsonibacter faecis]
REMLRDGIISATVSQQPDVQGALPLQILYDLLVFGTAPQRKRYFTQLDIHIPQNT